MQYIISIMPSSSLTSSLITTDGAEFNHTTASTSSSISSNSSTEYYDKAQEWIDNNKENPSLLCTLTELSSYQWEKNKLNYSTGGIRFSMKHVVEWFEEKERSDRDLLRDVAHYRDSHKFTPLHWLVQARPPPDLVQRLIQIAPETLRASCNFGALPLHYACQKEASAEVVQILIQAYPQAVRERTGAGGLPIHYACESTKASPTSEVVQTLLDVYPGSAQVQDHFIGLPLHIACRTGASYGVIHALLEAYPKAAQSPNIHGIMPLHYACDNALSTPNVVSQLLQVYPDAAKITSSHGCLPLHLACKNPHLEIMDLLLSAYPASINIPNGHGDLPSVILQKYATAATATTTTAANQQQKLHLMHKAIQKDLSPHLIQLLLKAFPESCMALDSDGMLPLHYACSKHPTKLSIETVMILTQDGNPDSSSMPNREGKAPLQLLRNTLAYQDNHGRAFLHTWASTNTFTVSSTKQLEFFMEIYSEGIFLPDNLGMLPFHHACLNATSSIDILLMFIQSHPESILKV
jgi:ankyrin repeat protein